jgi:hypothetical protein
MDPVTLLKATFALAVAFTLVSAAYALLSDSQK